MNPETQRLLSAILKMLDRRDWLQQLAEERRLERLLKKQRERVA